MRIFVFLILYLPLTTIAEIRLELSPDTCLPGDTLELRAHSAFEKFKTFELVFPKNDKIHVVARRTEPIMLVDGKYQQTETWIIQAKAPGEISLDNLKAVIRKGDKEAESPLPELTLTVAEYPQTAPDSFDPEPLPAALGQSSKPRTIVPYIVVLIIAISFAFRLRRSFKGSNPSDAPEAKPVLSEIMSALARGNIPYQEIESILSEDDSTLATPTRGILERAIYGKPSDPEMILKQLKATSEK